MANLCWNYIMITGEDIIKIDDLFVEGKTLGYEDMANLLGKSTEGLVHEDFGTKWFEVVNVSLEDNVLTIGGSSAWAPPIGFFQHLSEMYKIHVEIDYEECGMDFGGKCIIEDGNADDHELSYMGCMMEYGDGITNFLDSIADREYKSIDDFYEEYEDDEDFLSRLTEENKQEIEEAILNTIENGK